MISIVSLDHPGPRIPSLCTPLFNRFLGILLERIHLPDMDPNFPPALNIRPLELQGVAHVPDNQQQAIAQYGIAGRVWEASKPLIRYFTPQNQSFFEPPCPIFDHAGSKRIIELGSGQALASLHLAQHLDTEDVLVLTDLPNVVPLCRHSADAWKQDHNHGAQVFVESLAWGEDIALAKGLGPFDFIVMCDLIYFPHLYPPLLRTLLQLTEQSELTSDETFGPLIILSYFSRTLALEESFFQAFGQYFQLRPVIGVEGDAKIYHCRRWRVTEQWRMPEINTIMSGGVGVARGRDFGLVDELFASLEY